MRHEQGALGPCFPRLLRSRTSTHLWKHHCHVGLTPRLLPFLPLLSFLFVQLSLAGQKETSMAGRSVNLCEVIQKHTGTMTAQCPRKQAQSKFRQRGANGKKVRAYNRLQAPLRGNGRGSRTSGGSGGPAWPGKPHELSRLP